MERKTFPGTLESLDEIRQVVKQDAYQANLSKKVTYNLMVAVDEVATNIIVHGYQEAGLEGTVDLITEQADGEFKVILEDDAIPFNPLQQKLPDEAFFAKPLEERPIGGMGIHLVIKSVDEFRYEYANSRNRNIFIITINDQ